MILFGSVKEITDRIQRTHIFMGIIQLEFAMS